MAAEPARCPAAAAAASRRTAAASRCGNMIKSCYPQAMCLQLTPSLLSCKAPCVLPNRLCMWHRLGELLPLHTGTGEQMLSLQLVLLDNQNINLESSNVSLHLFLTLLRFPWFLLLLCLHSYLGPARACPGSTCPLRGGLVPLSLCVVSLANSVCVCSRTCFTIILS